jgi:SagB-type dehydrogenase family enzyme
MMKRSCVLGMAVVLALGCLLPAYAGQAAPAGESRVVKLPPPRMEGGRPLMEVLKARHSSREFKPEKLSPQVLSDLLWAADGINRPASGDRTAPSSHNIQNIILYVVLAEGVYTYDPAKNSLDPVVEGDLRSVAGTQDFVKTAPLNIVYVADFSKIQRGDEATKMWVSAAHVGFIAQNVYLFCASEGLAVVVRAMIDRETVTRAFKLGPDLRPVLAQTVGYPAAK